MLVAFFKTVNGIKAAVEPLIESLSRRLSLYMVPSACLPVEEVPTMQTGKTDRRQVRELGVSFTVEQISNLNTARSKWRRPENSQGEVTSRIVGICPWGSIEQ
jgi:hypothetical protein